MSATTQINRGQYKLDELLSADIKKYAPRIEKILRRKVFARMDNFLTRSQRSIWVVSPRSTTATLWV
ncbi:hypothetical protein NITHO_460020 [Nitrolancea hollandica Lb]|uniref:Uncharacterized protein n=1 Tax=Nitrolancea hollandica Lb TaxID=1129897 RepID=I4EKH2_9BACT|nr:hypothetical protein NITHO_460020 [Nitrolancea hollandica Lb]